MEVTIEQINNILDKPNYIDKVKLGKVCRLLLLDHTIVDTEVLKVANLASAIRANNYLKCYKAIYDYLVSKCS